MSVKANTQTYICSSKHTRHISVKANTPNICLFNMKICVPFEQRSMPARVEKLQLAMHWSASTHVLIYVYMYVCTRVDILCLCAYSCMYACMHVGIMYVCSIKTYIQEYCSRVCAYTHTHTYTKTPTSYLTQIYIHIVGAGLILAPHGIHQSSAICLNDMSHVCNSIHTYIAKTCHMYVTAYIRV